MSMEPRFQNKRTVTESAWERPFVAVQQFVIFQIPLFPELFAAESAFEGKGKWSAIAIRYFPPFFRAQHELSFPALTVAVARFEEIRCGVERVSGFAVSSELFEITELLTAPSPPTLEWRQIVFIADVAIEIVVAIESLSAMFALELSGGVRLCR